MEPADDEAAEGLERGLSDEVVDDVVDDVGEVKLPEVASALGKVPVHVFPLGQHATELSAVSRAVQYSSIGQQSG